MYYSAKNTRALLQHADVAAAFEDWLRQDEDRLVASALLLGGKAWQNRALNVIRDISAGAPIFELLPDLQALRNLLMLDLVDNFASEEARLFAMVHPDDPRADDARICAEALERGVTAISVLMAAGVDQPQDAA